MERYDLEIKGSHIIRITIQLQTYKGHFMQEIGGTGYGRDMLLFTFTAAPDDIVNDCKFYRINNNLFTATLQDDRGHKLEIEGTAEYFDNLIVGMEIIAQKPEIQLHTIKRIRDFYID